jgi:hypothetical protein
MCYFLYGAINDGINSDDYDKVMKKSNYHFNLGNIKDVNKCVKKCEDEFRITFNYCDCKTSIGEKDINKKDLK